MTNLEYLSELLGVTVLEARRTPRGAIIIETTAGRVTVASAAALLNPRGVAAAVAEGAGVIPPGYGTRWERVECLQAARCVLAVIAGGRGRRAW